MLKKNLVQIGINLLISLPDDGVYDVPAKIDTGADSSAIWASQIEVNDGELSFVLFEKDSPHYTGKVIKTKEFTTSKIKNSFGHVERRYKVKLKAEIAGRLINVRFTLANRGNNSYSVLIGRKTLHGKFLVDVSHKHIEVIE